MLPPIATRFALTSGKLVRGMVITVRPLASLAVTGVGTFTAMGAAGSGGRTRSASLAGWTTVMPAGAVRGVVTTVDANAILSPLLAVVSLVVAPCLLLVSYRLRSRVFPATWDAQQREGELVQVVDEDVSGVRVVKAFGQERREGDRFADAAAAQSVDLAIRIGINRWNGRMKLEAIAEDFRLAR